MLAYLDNSATTRCYDSVAELVRKIMLEDFGNPSSMHHFGVEAEKYVKESRKIIADTLKVKEKEIIFTSGGTESDNTALIGCAMANKRAGMHLITTTIEHPAILDCMAHLEGLGFEVTYLPVDANGIVRLDKLEAAVREDTILVSVMHTNNEIGSVQPLEEISRIIKAKNPKIIFHVDAVQGFGKAKIFPKKMGIDLLSVSGHKIHGPKGVGFLYKDEKVKMHSIIFGGGQQGGIRSGTENVPGIAGIGQATKEIYADIDKEIATLFSLKLEFIKKLRELDGVTINGINPEIEAQKGLKEAVEKSAPHIVSASFKGVRAEVLLHSLEDKGIYVSSGSACATNKGNKGSHVLKAAGITKELLDSTLRFSMSVFTTEEELQYTVDTLIELLPILRKYSRH